MSPQAKRPNRDQLPTQVCAQPFIAGMVPWQPSMMMSQVPAVAIAAPNLGMDLDLALLRLPHDLDSALDAWTKVLKVVSADARTNVTITFPTPRNISSPAELHTVVRAMGIHMHETVVPGIPAPSVAPPFGSVAGDPSQPAVIVVWQVSPEAKTTFQVNTKRRTLDLKGRRGAMDLRKELLVTFFGSPMSVIASATAVKKGSANVMPQSRDIRAMLVARAAQG